MNKVILRYNDGGELTVTLNEDVLDSRQIVLNGTLFTYLQVSKGLPVFRETIQPHVVTINKNYL